MLLQLISGACGQSINHTFDRLAGWEVCKTSENFPVNGIDIVHFVGSFSIYFLFHFSTSGLLKLLHGLSTVILGAYDRFAPKITCEIPNYSPSLDSLIHFPPEVIPFSPRFL